MTSHGIGYMCKIKVKMTKTLYFSILQDGVMKTIEWYRFNSSHIISMIVMLNIIQNYRAMVVNAKS